MLRPQDVLCVLKISCLAGQEWTFRELGRTAGLSSGEAYNVYARLKSSGLLYERGKETKLVAPRLLDFLVHGVPTAYYQERGQVARGMLTGSSAPPLAAHFPAAEGDVPLVWPTTNGKARGESLAPIYKTAPAMAAADARLYELLVLVDGLRSGKPREKKLAAELLEQRLAPGGAAEAAAE